MKKKSVLATISDVSDYSTRNPSIPMVLVPTIGIQLETAAFGPLLVSICVEAAGCRILSGRGRTLRAGKVYDDLLGAEAHDANWGPNFDD